MLRRTTGQWLTDAGTFVLPSLVGAAIYLPNGLLMPSRLVILALTATAAWRFLRRPARNPVLAGVVARFRDHPVLARTRQMALSWAREAVAALEGLEEATLAGTRERLAGDGIQAQGVQCALAEAGERARVVRDAMEQFAHLLVDRAA